VIPKGATATGRIVRLEKYDNYSVLGVEFFEIDAPGILARMKGKLIETVGPTRPHFALRTRTPPQPGEGIIQLTATQRRLLKGCIMFWRT
jgi:hypothetical protein